MRSKTGFYGSIVLVLGVPIALASAIALNGAGASEIIHIALAASFFLFAAAVFDFPLARVRGWGFAAGIGILAVIFLLQALADLTHSPEIGNVAYGVLGQSLEKWLGYLFIVWCAAVWFFHGRGVLRLLGLAALLLVLGAEIYGYAVLASGEAPPQALKFLYLPLIAWVGWLSRTPAPA